MWSWAGHVPNEFYMVHWEIWRPLMRLLLLFLLLGSYRHVFITFIKNFEGLANLVWICYEFVIGLKQQKLKGKVTFTHLIFDIIFCSGKNTYRTVNKMKWINSNRFQKYFKHHNSIKIYSSYYSARKGKTASHVSTEMLMNKVPNKDHLYE